ncbi:MULTISPECIES: MobV family relaxase [Bacillota]|jgi:cell division protein FtsB|uniref:MobV family relaxase n=1 Tax=Bacillota TaxID=1239 RepID=UPI002908930C|nr:MULTISPECIES: MobV family relaxase [Bacillota]MDU6547630.1 MobV family relaxase [Anaerococcus vaginalis]MDU6574251.1 MobV family relaxase [Gemella haemolysans]
MASERNNMCGIMRVEKRKIWDVTGIEMEANRTKETAIKFKNSDIDISKTDSNLFFKKRYGWRKAIDELLKVNNLKRRKDSVVLLDGLYTASPDFFKNKTEYEIQNYFKDCLNFHVNTYCGGDKELLVNAVIHLDETTPHMQVASVPITKDLDGKAHLSAKLIMGNKKDYRDRQNAFYLNVTKEYGLDRGEIKKNPKEIKKHVHKRQWELKQAEEQLNVIMEQTKEMQNYYNLVENSVKEIRSSFIEMFIDDNNIKSMNIAKTFGGKTITSLKNFEILDKYQRSVARFLNKSAEVYRNLERYKQAYANIDSLNKERTDIVEEINSLKAQLDGLDDLRLEMQNLKYTKAFIKANKTKFDEFIKSKEFEKELSDEFLEIW